MAGSNKLRRYDSGLTSFMLFMLSFCIISVFFSMVDGSAVMFYAGFPMIFTTASAASSLLCTCDFVSEQVEKRLLRKKYTDAAALFHCALQCAGIQAVMAFVVFFVGSGLVGRVILGSSLTGDVLKQYVPALIALPFLGVFKGYLQATGRKKTVRLSLWFLSACFLVCGVIFGIWGAGKGAKVGRLLRNDDMTYVYAACGIGDAISAVAVVTTVFLGIASFWSMRSMQRSYKYRQDDLFGNDGSEDAGELRNYCIQNILGGMGPAVVLSLGILIGFRLWCGTQSSHSNTLASMWGGFIGIGFPVCAGLGLLAAMPFTALVTQVIRADRSGKKKLRRVRLGMLLRLSAYVGIPMSAFVFAAAKEIVAMFPELTFKAEETAILTLKAGSPLIFLIQTGCLVLVIYWRCSNRRVVVISGCIAVFAEVVSQVVLMVLGVGITMNCWPLVIMGSIFLIILYAAGRRSVTAGVDAGWIMDDILIVICAVIAAIPLIVLNDYLVLVMPGAAAFALMLAVYAGIYIFCSIVLHAADLRNIQRVPFGDWILQLAILLGAAGREEDG